MKQRILVTGGAGFIGSHLCRRLLAEGYQVYCLDNLFTGEKRNIQDLRENPDFKLIVHDIIDPWFVDSIDGVFNLACPASPPHYQFNAIRTIKANTIGMINMLGLAKKHKVRILQASTSEVYGDPEQHPQTEAYWGHVNPIGPRSCYDEGKRVAETLFADYHRQNGVDIRIARIFNTYGPRMHPNDGRVVSNFVVQAIRGEDITIFGDGSQTRSFCYVDDLVEGLIRLMDSEGDEAELPVNLGNPDEFTIRELAEKVIAKTGTRSRLVSLPLPVDDPRQRRPDISRAARRLGWKPTIPLDRGIDSTIDWFRKELGFE